MTLDIISGLIVGIGVAIIFMGLFEMRRGRR